LTYENGMARVKNRLVEQCIQQKMKERYFRSGFSAFICDQQLLLHVLYYICIFISKNS